MARRVRIETKAMHSRPAARKIAKYAMIVRVDVIAHMPTACLIWSARLAERLRAKGSQEVRVAHTPSFSVETNQSGLRRKTQA
jgi:hypothetical protein